MKVFGQRKRAAAAVLAAGTLMALAACTPANPGAAASGSSLVSAAPSAAQPTTTAPASPSAAPGTSATVGAMVPGFPETLLPVMPAAKVVSSSFDKTTEPATVALVGSISAPSAEVLAFYTKELEAQGFKAVPGETVGAVPSKDFLRGETETVNISVLETAGVSTFTIGANVAAESVK
ncbi:outer membrane receptor protein involved in Fe transport [Pseudarthrobacter oxydans]|uniref:hypothetical protein n=1 Tax=Pseudarthrobacter oxydans TaxID=1671 RepID=UPI00277E7F25|nr:hypothetical protein [Pseudarthrobacter oxydans]MDP9983275.1 outer membrane receptor protein involved in Fe transport [Pseudarthrobacter oxydans]